MVPPAIKVVTVLVLVIDKFALQLSVADTELLLLTTLVSVKPLPTLPMVAVFVIGPGQLAVSTRTVPVIAGKLVLPTKGIVARVQSSSWPV